MNSKSQTTGARGYSLLVECLPSVQEVLNLICKSHKPAVVTPSMSPGLRMIRSSRLSSDSKASLGYMTTNKHFKKGHITKLQLYPDAC